MDCETFDEAKRGFKQGLNSSFNLLDIGARRSILVASRKFFLELKWCTLDYFFFSRLWVTMIQNSLTEILQTWRLRQNNIVKHLAQYY